MYRILLLLFLFLGGHALTWGQDSTSLRILFVGNSYTYFWNLPQSVAALATDQGLAVVIDQSTAGGVNLGQHWRGEKDLQTREKIRTGHYDLVVLQDHSRRAVDYPDSLRRYAGRLIDLIQASGAEPLLYMTWPRAWDPYMIEQISEVYGKVARDHGVRLVPVGAAWPIAKRLRPELTLYHPDGSHPSPTGTYLTACVMYAWLFDRSPVGLPARIATTDANGEKLYLNIQTPENATFLQKVAREATENFLSQP